MFKEIIICRKTHFEKLKHRPPFPIAFYGNSKIIFFHFYSKWLYMFEVIPVYFILASGLCVLFLLRSLMLSSVKKNPNISLYPTFYKCFLNIYGSYCDLPLSCYFNYDFILLKLISFLKNLNSLMGVVFPFCFIFYSLFS